LRLDFFSGRGQVDRFLRWLGRQSKLPALIATCRRHEAGGHFRGSIGAQVEILRQAVAAGCRWCDVELETARHFDTEQLGNALVPARLLLSAHDFRRLPPALSNLIARLDSCQGNAIKIAAATRSFREVCELLSVVYGRSDVVAIPMGDDMMGPRILALRQGSALAYAPVGQSTAPGQIPFAQMDRIFHLRRRFSTSKSGPNSETAVYGVIGDPVGHSLSPLMHNAAFAARGKNAVYLPFRVRELPDFMASINPLDISGFSVTIPHKENIVRYLDECDSLAAEIGAVNTVLVRAGKLCGYNTDFIGVLRAMERRLPLAGSRVLLIGAGGAARAAAFALARAGAAVAVWARRAQRARALAHAVSGEAIDREAIAHHSFDAIVNCTPVGMYPHRGSPLELRELNCRLVMDLIYRPLKTELLRRAERRGIEAISGVDMFVAQAAAQWELWTGESPPVNVMRRVVLAELQKEEKSRSR
jgi:3-dehydroquinate dehydratase/shikimate dehydrogenase